MRAHTLQILWDSVHMLTTYTRTQQSLPPLWPAIIQTISIEVSTWFLNCKFWQNCKNGILINVNVNCEIMKCNKHQQQITNLQSVWLKQKFNLVSRCTSQNQTLIKFLKFFCLWQCQLFFLFIMYNGFIFDEKGVFYILTAFSSFTENVSIHFENKNFKSLIML